jgi:hypothetical protein
MIVNSDVVRVQAETRSIAGVTLRWLATAS